MSRLTNTAAGTIGLLLILLALLAVTGHAFAADPEAEQINKEAREALNKAEYAEAAELFAKSRQLAEVEEEVSRAIYWEAFSRARLHKTQELKLAAELLALEEMEYADRETRAESEALAARIYGELAQRGEVDAVREINERASAEEMRAETRIAALQALLRMDPERALPMLEKVIQDDSPENRELRRHAVMVACHEDSPQFQELLLTMLKTETDPDFLMDIAMCLAMNPSEEGLNELMALFEKTKDPQVAEAVIISLSQMDGSEHSDRVFAFLVNTAKDKNADSDIRQHAIISLAHYGREQEVLELLKGFSDPDEDVEIQEAMLMAMAQLDLKAADETLMTMITNDGLDDEFKAHALYLLGANGKISVETLKEIYQGAGPDSEELKFQIWHLLSMHEDKDLALDTMLEFARQEKDPELKQEMVFWLGQFDDPRAADFLVEILEGKH